MRDRPSHYQGVQNFITAEKERDIIMVFYNDYFDKPYKYKRNYSYANELLKFTWSTTNNSVNQKFDFLMSDNLDEALLLAKRMKFKCAIVQTPGHVIRGDFVSELNKMREQDWLLMGHILETKEYLKLHEQCFALNLTKLDEDELYPGEYNPKILVPLYDRSEENFHDNYTPTWVKFNEQYDKRETHWGWHWIARGLINSQVLVFNENVRKSKIHLYPENPGSYETWYRENNESQMASVINQFVGGERKIHIVNNETISRELISNQTRQESFDNVIVLASGFYGLKMSKLYSPKKLIYYDILQPMLDITKNINETWNGIDNLDAFYEGHVTFNNPNLRRLDHLSEGIFSDTAELEDYLQEFKSIEKEYHQFNVITDPEKLLAIIPESGSTYIWLDSVYTYWFNLWEHRPREIESSYRTILDGIAKHENDVWLHVKDPNGFIRVIHNKKHKEEFSKVMCASNYRTWS